MGEQNPLLDERIQKAKSYRAGRGRDGGGEKSLRLPAHAFLDMGSQQVITPALCLAGMIHAPDVPSPACPGSGRSR
jgi:hypothetical protein